MIRKLKIKFVALAMVSLFILLAVIVSGMSILNYNTVISEADEILEILSRNKGMFPEPSGNKPDRLPQGMSPETPYESRFFSVSLDEDDDIIGIETSRIITVDEETAEKYAEAVIKRNAYKGFADNFRYVRRAEVSGSRIVFLDCGRRLDSYYSFLNVSIGMSVAGFIVVFVIVFILSGRIIRPIAESHEKQKRFIADAGHEIKTPLTIIGANIDVLEMEQGENESLTDIRQQITRLRELTNDLVMLTRMEEAENRMTMIDFPLSEIVAETAYPFRAIAMQQGKEFICNIQPMLTLNGNDKAIRQLVSILLDNALKYSPSGGVISLDMVMQNHNIYLSVMNTTENTIDSKQLEHIFDRFYRTDSSRNSETGGYGIGLSVAKAIVSAHGGKLQALIPEEGVFRITAALPM